MIARIKTIIPYTSSYPHLFFSGTFNDFHITNKLSKQSLKLHKNDGKGKQKITGHDA